MIPSLLQRLRHNIVFLYSPPCLLFLLQLFYWGIIKFQHCIVTFEFSDWFHPITKVKNTLGLEKFLNLMWYKTNRWYMNTYKWFSLLPNTTIQQILTQTFNIKLATTRYQWLNFSRGKGIPDPLFIYLKQRDLFLYIINTLTLVSLFHSILFLTFLILYFISLFILYLK